MSDLRSYITRVLNVLAEIDDLNADKKEIYREIAGDGFDRTVVSQVVGHIRKKAAKPGKFAEQSALFDLYLTEYEGVGTPVATHAAREPVPAHEEFDAETGEIIEPQPLAAQTDHALPVTPAPSPAESEAVAISAPVQPGTLAVSGIPAWARVGAKVVLMNDEPGPLNSGPLLCQRGDIYTLIEVTDRFDAPACRARRDESGWEHRADDWALISRFRPLVSIEDDIATHFAQHLDHRAPEKADA